MKVYISPSTQEHNKGAIPGYIEETEMNIIADILIPKLNSYGITTYRNKPEMNLQGVVKDSNSHNVDLHLAIHSNATGGNPTARGVVACIVGKGYNAEKYANMIIAKIKPLQPFSNRATDILVAPKLYEVKYTDAPAVIVEVDFHDNIEGARWIQQNREELANALLDATLEYFKIECKKAISFDELKTMLADKGINSITI